MSSPGFEKEKRIVSVDQLRGYAIFGMLLVNASGLFLDPVRPFEKGSTGETVFGFFVTQLSHANLSFSYADTIAPLFVFVVGMGMRLSWLRRSERLGPREIRKGMVKRFTLLVLIGFAIYAGWLWDALMDIGLAGLLAVMLIDKKPRTRIAAAFLMAAGFQALHMFTSYGIWSMHGKFSLDNPEYIPLLARLVPLHEELFDCTLNGGPLGAISWCVMLLFGSVAYDWMMERNDKKFVISTLAWGVGLCVAAYILRLEWPGVKEAWPFSARWMTAPFPLWATGLCFLQLLAFYLICDKLNLRLPTFTSVGMNPLFIYIAHTLVLDVAEGFTPQELSCVVGVSGLLLFYGAFAGLAYYLYRKNIYIKI